MAFVVYFLLKLLFFNSQILDSCMDPWGFLFMPFMLRWKEASSGLMALWFTCCIFTKNPLKVASLCVAIPFSIVLIDWSFREQGETDLHSGRVFFETRWKITEESERIGSLWGTPQEGSRIVFSPGSCLPGFSYKMLWFPSWPPNITKPLFKE